MKNFKCLNILIILVTLAVLILSVPSAFAVDTNNYTNDNVILNSNTTNNIYVDNNTNIQTVIDNASEGCNIVLSNGTYHESGLIVNKSLNFIGDENSIINATNFNTSIFTITGKNTNIMFSGLNFIGGSSNFGGALDIYDAKVTISNCNFTGAYASNNGGCIANLGGNLIIGNSFFNNCSSGHNGGSINCFNGDLTLTNSFFANCKCDYDGGAISLNNYSSGKIIGNFFINNTAGEWGACVYEWNAITVNITNNIFISNNAKKGACLFIYGANNITGNVFKNNSADYGAGVYVEEAYGSVLSSVECNFNSFINNTALNGSDVYIYRCSLPSNFNNNWWGINNPLTNISQFNQSYYDIKNDVGLPSTWLNTKATYKNSIITVEIVSSNTSSKDNINLPVFANLYYNNNLIDTNILINGTTDFNVSSYELDNILINVGNQNFTFTSTNTSTILNSSNVSVIYGYTNKYTVKLTTNTGKALSNEEVLLNITNLSNGLNKVYKILTDNEGIASLPINLLTGAYSMNASYSGNNQYTSSTIFTYYNIITNLYNTNLIVNNFNETFDSGNSLIGKLSDVWGNPIVNRIVNLKLSRLSDGVSKTYYVTTDTNGEYNLPINLNIGFYKVDCSFDGDNPYLASSTLGTITVY